VTTTFQRLEIISGIFQNIKNWINRENEIGESGTMGNKYFGSPLKI
jgi:hypothetical protein